MVINYLKGPVSTKSYLYIMSYLLHDHNKSLVIFLQRHKTFDVLTEIIVVLFDNFPTLISFRYQTESQIFRESDGTPLV